MITLWQHTIHYINHSLSYHVALFIALVDCELHWGIVQRMGIWALGIGALSVVVLGWGIYNEHKNEFPSKISSNYVWGWGRHASM